MGKVISIINNKGGVGKTTCTYNIAYELSQLKKKVLMIDFDAQSSLSIWNGINPLEKYANIEHVIRGTMDIEECILPTPTKNLDLIPCSIDFATIDFYLIGIMGREQVLKKALEKIKDKYDYIIIDNNPSLGITTINSLFASEYAIAPLEPSYISYRGLEVLQTTMTQVQEFNKELKDVRVLINMYDSREKHSKEVIDMIKGKYYIIPQYINRSVKFRESSMYFESVREYSGDKFPGAIAFRKIAKEIISWEKIK